MLDIKIPSVGESISEVQISKWHKKVGEWVAKDENLCDLETEKASVQIPAPAAGFLRVIFKNNEEFAKVGELICQLEPASAPSQSAPPQDSPAQSPSQSIPSPTGSAPPRPEARIMPAAQRIMAESGLSADQVQATGPGGRILKEDVMRASSNTPAIAAASGNTSLQSTQSSLPSPPTGNQLSATRGEGNRMEEVKPLSMIRRTIAARLVQAQQTAALLTTFNEVDMNPVMELRKKYRDAFQERHGVKLGFMSFFAKAAVEALRRFPSVNAELRGNNIVYHHYHDIGIAIGGGKGLVVPVLRNVERLGFADIERAIGEFASRAMANRLMPEDLEGGTFTISNGGVYGSMLSTPIVNPPQSAILGLHAIQDRPMARDGQVVILPMMYLALTYDHRIIDGREAVSFLKTIKEVIEDPARLFLEV